MYVSKNIIFLKTTLQKSDIGFPNVLNFSVNCIYEAMVFFVEHQPVLAKKEAKRAFMQVCLPTDVFWRTEASCLATMIATMVYPFRKVSLVARSQALSFVRGSTKKTLQIPLEMKLVKLFPSFFFFLTVIIIVVFNYLSLSLSSFLYCENIISLKRRK